MNIDRTVTLWMSRNIDTCVRIRTDTLVIAVGTFVCLGSDKNLKVEMMEK
jgi:hypothetical protein